MRSPQRIAEREVESLDREDVREVGGELDDDVELQALHALVLDPHTFRDAAADEPFARDRHRVGWKVRARRVPQVVHGVEVVDGA